MGWWKQALPDSFVRENFSRLARTCAHPRERMRYLGLSHLQQGAGITAIAQMLQVTRQTVTRWVRRYCQEGLEGLREHPRPGRTPILTAQERAWMLDMLDTLCKQQQGGRVLARDIQRAVQDKSGKTFHLDSVYRWLHEAGMSWVTSRSRHPQSNTEAQREFQKKIPSSRARGRGRQGRQKTPARLVPG